MPSGSRSPAHGLRRTPRAALTFYQGVQSALVVAITTFTVLPAYEIWIRPHVAPVLGLRAAAILSSSDEAVAKVVPPKVQLAGSGPAGMPASEASVGPAAASAAPAAPAAARALAQPKVEAPKGSSSRIRLPVSQGPDKISVLSNRPPRGLGLCPGQAYDKKVHGVGIAALKAKRQSTLALIHIPRTGGTSIERCTSLEVENVSRWGELNNVLHNNGKRTILNNKTGAKCYGQHAPPSAIHFYDDKETFCAIRDPYARIISIFGYRHKMFSDATGECSVQNMNEKIIKWMTMVKKGQRYLHDCHVLPQAAWVYGWDPVQNAVVRDKKMCHHVLQYKNLVEDFNALMESKGYHYRLTKTKLNPSYDRCAVLKKADLWQQTRDLLQEVYSDDFELFGFEKLPRDGGGGPSATEAATRSADQGKPASQKRVSLCPGQELPAWLADHGRDIKFLDARRGSVRIDPLTLIHIPRTGGTTIEDCTKKEQVDAFRWGTNNNELHKPDRITFNTKGNKCWGQHVPPNVLDYYKGKETFCVVRNPYARMISEFGHRQAMYSDKTGECTVENMNEQIKDWLNQAKNVWGPYFHDCHMLPQSAFVYGWSVRKEETDRDIQSCRHILRYESLHEDFNGLMEKRGYPYRLTHFRQQGSNAACRQMRPSDLWKETRALLQEMYRDDFELLGYGKDDLS